MIAFYTSRMRAVNEGENSVIKKIVLGCIVSAMPFCLVYGDFVFQAGFKGPVECSDIKEANIGIQEECHEWPASVYNNASAFSGLTFTLQTTQANGTEPYMQRDPLVLGPNGQPEPNQEIPFEVKWQPCFNDFGSGGSPPGFMDLPANQGISVTYQYGGSFACSTGAEGKNGALKLIRKPLAELPEEGDYIASITFVVSAE